MSNVHLKSKEKLLRYLAFENTQSRGFLHRPIEVSCLIKGFVIQKSHFSSSSSKSKNIFGNRINGYSLIHEDTSSIFKISRRCYDSRIINVKGGMNDKHKSHLLSTSNITRLKNDKIRQLQQQGEDDRKQNEVYTHVDYHPYLCECTCTSIYMYKYIYVFTNECIEIYV